MCETKQVITPSLVIYTKWRWNLQLLTIHHNKLPVIKICGISLTMAIYIINSVMSLWKLHSKKNLIPLITISNKDAIKI